MEYFVIGDEDTVLGFSLVGVSGIACSSEEDVKAAWNKATEDKEHGVIIITDECAAFIRDTVDRYLFTMSFPLVVEIPSRKSTGSTDLRELVNEAIGVSI